MAAAGGKHWEQDKEATVYIGNLDERVTDALVWELMLQAGRIQNVHLPKDRVTQTHQGYGFVEFVTEQDAEYAAKIMNQIRLFGKPIRVNKASADKQSKLDTGAELFVGNLDPMVDEKTLFDTFNRFGTLAAPPKISRDEANLSRGFGFVSFVSFEASDEAIANMHGQFLMNKEISVQYAFKKDGKGERHGDAAERMLAAEATKHNVTIPLQPLPVQLTQPTQPVVAPPVPAGNLANGTPGAMPNGVPTPSPVGYGTPNGAYQPHVPAPSPVPAPAPAPQPRPTSTTPLPPPPSGLPARPPPSQAGYGGPTNFPPPGFPQAPPAFGGPPGPMGFGGPPSGFVPPGQQGSPPPGMQVPPGFQQQGPPGMGYPQPPGGYRR